MSHVILLGDSIFDNAAYVGYGPAVIAQLRAVLPQQWQATLLAVDGSITTSVARQLDRLPADASHLVLSIGGNDVLRKADILRRPAQSTAEALQQLGQVAEQFEYDYNAMLQGVLARQLPTAISTIYYPCFPDTEVQRLTVTALTVFNDCIIRAAITNRLPLLDLRLICNEEADYANPIEPSVQGGEKISRMIRKLLLEYDFKGRQPTVFA